MEKDKNYCPDCNVIIEKMFILLRKRNEKEIRR